MLICCTHLKVVASARLGSLRAGSRCRLHWYWLCKDVGKYPGLVQDKVRALMNCSFPSQNWSSSFSAPPSANPPIWAHIPEVAVSNPTYPYRPYQFIGAWEWNENNELSVRPLEPSERHEYKFLIFNEPIHSYDNNLLSPRAAAEVCPSWQSFSWSRRWRSSFTI